MIKLTAALMLTCAVLAPPARAADTSMTRLAALTREIGTSYPITSMWFEMLDRVASNCGQRIDKATLMLWNDRMGNNGIYGPIVQHIREGTMQNSMSQYWIVIETNDRDQACSYAISLWGEDGDQFPGVLRPH